MAAAFQRHSDIAVGLSQSALMAALIEVDAPVLLSSEGASADLLFRRADANARGAVDLNECEMLFCTILKPSRRQQSMIHDAPLRFMLVANLPDDLEMFLVEHSLSVSAASSSLSLHTRVTPQSAQFAAPFLRNHLPRGVDQLSALASLALEDLDAAAAASADYLKDELRKLQQLLLQIHGAQDSLREQLDKEPGKYQIRKMGAGSLEHFHNGLTDRIGKRRFAVFVFEHVFFTRGTGSPNLDFEKAMRAEHCSLGGCSFQFTSPNYNITTAPRQEWRYLSLFPRCIFVTTCTGTSLAATTACPYYVPICFTSAALCPFPSCWRRALRAGLSSLALR
jgi:hypothetical protein